MNMRNQKQLSMKFCVVFRRPSIANLGELNPYVAAAFEEWRMPQGHGSGALSAAVARQPAAMPVLDSLQAAGAPSPCPDCEPCER